MAKGTPTEEGFCASPRPSFFFPFPPNPFIFFSIFFFQFFSARPQINKWMGDKPEAKAWDEKKEHGLSLKRPRKNKRRGEARPAPGFLSQPMGLVSARASWLCLAWAGHSPASSSRLMLSLDKPTRRRPRIRLSSPYWPEGEQMPYNFGQIKAAVRQRLGPGTGGASAARSLFSHRVAVAGLL